VKSWRRIESEVGAENVVYLVSVPLSASFERRTEGLFPVEKLLYIKNVKERDRLKLFSVPQTIHIGDGVVKAIDVGVLSPQRIEYFENLQLAKKRNMSLSDPARLSGQGGNKPWETRLIWQF
jgi:hypothetical protein